MAPCEVRMMEPPVAVGATGATYELLLRTFREFRPGVNKRTNSIGVETFPTR